ncbi:MAG: 5'-nucleotidase C-terminal domain-containing protein [Clostridia bacterium]|nr:5'-nucleotidase C-terminal domain-containing protein [Clostridia bacterium]
MRKTISLVLAVLMMLVLLPAVKLSPAVAEETPEVTLDFTLNTWNLPTQYTKATDEYTDSETGCKITLAAGSSGDGYKHGGSYLIFGKTDATLTLPAFDFDVTKIVVVGREAASGNTMMNVFVGNNAVSTETTGCKGTNTYAIAEDYQAAGNIYSLKVTNNYNAQAVTIEIYKKTGETPIVPEPTTYTVSFDANGGTGRMPSVTTTSPYRLPECGFTAPENMVFAYWALEGVEAIYNVNDQVELTGDVTFFAQWKDAPVFTDMEPVTELKNGDEVVIFNAASNKVMTGEEYYFENTSNQSKSKWEIKAADAALTDDVLAVPEEAIVLTVEILVPDTEGPESRSIDEEPNVYAFKTADGKYLYADNKHTRFVERDQENAENTFFQLEPVEGGFYIKCDSAVYGTGDSAKPQYIEYYNNYFTVYSMQSDKAPFTFQFYAEPGETPEPPVVEPTGDTVILFTNDVHCGIREGWGYAGLADLKKTLEAEGNEVILVDAGDHVQGGQIGSLTQGEAIIDIMNFVGYDLATLGNHEFDYGMDQLFALMEQAEYPYVSANFVNLVENSPNGLVLDAYKIFEANGKKIAFVGLSTPESITKSTPTYFMNEDNTAYIYGFCQDETGEGVYEAAQNAIDAAREEGADYVIVVGHMGIDEQSSPWMSTEVIPNITGVDVFIDGHSHSVINQIVEDKEGHSVLHGQTGTKLANIGKLTIDAEGGMLLEILPASEKVKDDPETDTFIKGIEDEFEALLNTVVAYTDHLLTVSDPETGTRWVRHRETNLGDLCADAYRYMFDADIAFVNGGGVRANIAEGDITFSQIIAVHPFGNTAVLAEVTGQQILDALEMGSRAYPGENGGFLQVSGLKYEIHPDVEPNCVVGSDKMWQGPVDPELPYRVQNVKILDKETGKYLPLDLEKTYTLAGHNYMIQDMGDGFAMFGNNVNILIDSGIPDNKVLIDYIQSMPVNEDGLHVVTGYTNPKGEGRIVVPNGETVVLFTNDVHCGIRDGWGYAGVADLKKSLEADGSKVILVDAGDNVQGGPIGSLTHGEAIIDIMNFVGYDLATLGNHEFDYGMTQLFALMEQAEYPFVSANFMDLTKNAPVLDAYKIFEANGKKIAFVGLSTPESITKSTPTYFMNEAGEYIYGFCQDDTGAGVYTAAQNAIDAAKAEGADYVIIVGHMGIDEQSQPWTAPEVIANVTGVDAFIDGHSHSVINTTVKDKENKDVLHGQTGTKLANVGKLTIAADGTLTMELLPASQKVQDDPETDEFIQDIEDEFDALLNTVVAYTDHDLTVNDPDTGARAVRNSETNLGDLCADAYQYMFDSDIAFVNGGGVRANIPTGDITFQQIINVHPFGNTAVLAEVTGQQILDALEMGARVCPSENGGFLQVAGLTYEIHTYVEANCVVGTDKMWAGPVDPEGEYRVKNVMVLNKESNEYEPLDLTKKYTLASHNYMLKDMGDGFAMFGPNITILEDSGKLDNQVLIDYIQSMPEIDGVHQVEGYTDPRGEGRITIVPEKVVTFYGEHVKSADVVEEDNGVEIYRYDVKVKGIDPETSVVGLQAFVEYDNNVLEFVGAASQLEGSTGMNENNGVISFAWASSDEGITLEDGSVVVSLYFKLIVPLEDGDSVDFYFVFAENGATTGYSFVSGDTVVEADNVKTEDGSITFSVPTELTIYGEDVYSLDIMVKDGSKRLYRYDIKVKDLPEAGLKINSAQVFLNYDKDLLLLTDVDSILEGYVFNIDQDKGDVRVVWATDSEVLLHNDDVLMTLIFEAPNAKGGEKADIVFTTNTLNTTSAVSFTFGGVVVEIEANTVNGSITFAVATLGDANCDGQVTAADAALILRSLVGLNELTAQGAFNADVNGDGEVTAEDAAIILRYIVKLIDKFPVEETAEEPVEP